jgi:glucose dehydrogenase
VAFTAPLGVGFARPDTGAVRWTACPAASSMNAFRDQGDHMPASIRTPVLAAIARAAAGALAVLTLQAFAADAPAADWPLHGLNAAATRYASLDQINAGNVHRLSEAWTFHSGIKATFQTTPIVVGERMYVSLPFSHVVALDATNGRELWRYTHERGSGKLCCGPASRGVAVAQGRVFVGTVDARLVALDAATGKVLWNVPVRDEAAAGAAATVAQPASARMNPADAVAAQPVVGASGVGVAMAPLVVDGLVLVGVNGVGYGVHTRDAVVGLADTPTRSGFLAAFDLHTGARRWQFDVTGPGWAGPMAQAGVDGLPAWRDLAQEKAALAQHADAWRAGGGSIYSTPALDRARGLVFFGTGNPSPIMEDSTRPGDNLHTSSLVALDVRTGKRVWHYQQVPHDLWGLDVSSPPVLFDLQQEGRSIPALAQPSKLGWVYVHDRRDGRLLFRSSPFVPQQNLLSVPTAQGVLMAPGIAGGANWSPSAYDPAQGTLFVPGIDMPTRYRVQDGEDGRPYVVGEPEGRRDGTLTALDLQNGGAIRWQRQIGEPAIGGVLATAGHLLFSGLGRQTFGALDSRTGQTLWQARCDAGVNAPPITYAVGGTQYVAVAVGGNALFGFTQGDELKVYRLAAPARD